MLVIAAGNIRSASTLQYNLAREVMDIYGYESMNHSEGDVWEKGSEFVFNNDALIIKNHFLPPRKFLQKRHIENGNVRVLMSHRDLRDVAVSLGQFQKASFDDVKSTIARMVHDDYKYREIVGNFALRQSYKALTEDTLHCLYEIAEYLQLPIPEEAADHIVRKYAIDVVRTVQHRMGEDGRRLTYLAPNHVGDGRTGKWKELLTDRQKTTLMRLTYDWLVENGYE